MQVASFEGTSFADKVTRRIEDNLSSGVCKFRKMNATITTEVMSWLAHQWSNIWLALSERSGTTEDGQRGRGVSKGIMNASRLRSLMRYVMFCRVCGGGASACRRPQM